jgi:hypothetical protein
MLLLYLLFRCNNKFVSSKGWLTSLFYRQLFLYFLFFATTLPLVEKYENTIFKHDVRFMVLQIVLFGCESRLNSQKMCHRLNMDSIDQNFIDEQTKNWKKRSVKVRKWERQSSAANMNVKSTSQNERNQRTFPTAKSPFENLYFRFIHRTVNVRLTLYPLKGLFWPIHQNYIQIQISSSKTENKELIFFSWICSLGHSLHDGQFCFESFYNLMPC